MAEGEAPFRVALDGFAMQLRRTELERVAAGLGTFDTSEGGDFFTLAEALRRLPVGDRAPTWELAVRHYGQQKPLARAAGEIGLDEVRAQALIEQFARQLAEVPIPERLGVEEQAADPNAALEQSGVARYLAPDLLANAVAHGERVDLDHAHEESLRTIKPADAGNT